MREIRVELTRPFGHYLLRVARLPIPPSAHDFWDCKYMVFFGNSQIYLRFLDYVDNWLNIYGQSFFRIPCEGAEGEGCDGEVEAKVKVFQVRGGPVEAGVKQVGAK